MFDDTVVVRSRAIATNVWEKPSSILLILLFRFPFGIFRERKLPHFSSSLTIYIYRIQWILSHTLAENCFKQRYYGKIIPTPLKTLNGVRFLLNFFSLFFSLFLSLVFYFEIYSLLEKKKSKGRDSKKSFGCTLSLFRTQKMRRTERKRFVVWRTRLWIAREIAFCFCLSLLSVNLHGWSVAAREGKVHFKKNIPFWKFCRQFVIVNTHTHSHTKEQA